MDKNIESEKKKEYQAPIVHQLDLSEAIMVAASRSGMGLCKFTFADQLQNTSSDFPNFPHAHPQLNL